MSTPRPDISVIVPLYNESESLCELVDWVRRVLDAEGFQWEIVMVDDGSTDSSWDEVATLAGQEPRVRGLRFRRNYGKSAALFCGFEAARGAVVVTLDADLQDSPDEIPALYRMIVEDGYDMVSGWKKLRHDPLGKRLPSKLFNATARAASGIKLHDFNSGIKAYRSAVVKSIEVYGEMHRWVPMLAKNAGFKRIGEKVVEHYPRKYGHSKFGWERMLKGFLDLISVSFMSRFGRRPFYLFGGLGSVMFVAGGVMTVWIIAEKLVRLADGQVVREVTDQPLFYLALLAIVLGVQLFLAGFIGELVNRNASDRNKYLIDEQI